MHTQFPEPGTDVGLGKNEVTLEAGHLWRLARPVVRYERILRIQGYSDLARVRPAIVKASQAMASRAGALSAPLVAHRRARI